MGFNGIAHGILHGMILDLVGLSAYKFLGVIPRKVFVNQQRQRILRRMGSRYIPSKLLFRLRGCGPERPLHQCSTGLTNLRPLARAHHHRLRRGSS